MASIRWGKFSGRNRGAGHGAKGRKCDKFDSKDAVKCKESECTRKRGFWRSRCMKIPIADVAIDIKTMPNHKGKSLCEVEVTKENVNAKSSFLTIGIQSNSISDYKTLQGAEFKRPHSCESIVGEQCKEEARDENFQMEGKWFIESLEDVKQIDRNSACVDDCIGHMECMEDPKGSSTVNSGCMAYVWQDAFSGERQERVVEACNSNMACKKAECLGADVYEKAGVKDCKNASEGGKSGDEDSVQGVNSKVAFNSGLDSMEVKEVDRHVCDAGTEKFDDSFSNVGMVTVPHDFVCWISKRVMEDPVVVASGRTFERASIQAWLDEGNTHCPITHDPLSHFQLIPNLTLKTLISSWLSSTSHDLGLETAQNSFSSCISSFSSCPSSMTASHQKFVSCSSFSISKLLDDMELDSFTSSSASSPPKLLLNAELHGFSSSSMSTLSSSTGEHVRDGCAHNFPPAFSSTGSSSCWDAELCTSQEIKVLESSPLGNSTQGENQLVLSKRSQECSPHSMLNELISLSRKPSMYTMSRIDSLVSDLQSDYMDIQRSAAAEIRLLAKHEDSNRILIANAGALAPLITLLCSANESIQLEATTALLNLSLNHTLKENIVKEGAVEALVGVLRDGLSVVVKENAAVALAHLAVCEANRSEIGAVGAVTPLITLLERGSSRGKKDAAAALYRLSSIDENKRRMVRAGAMRLVVGLMSKEGDKESMVDKAMAILSNLVSIEEGRVAFVEEDGIMSLLQVIQVGSQRTRGLAVPILFQLCTHSGKHRSLVLQKEPLPTLMSISKTANSRLRMQVAEMIEVLIVDA